MAGRADVAFAVTGPDDARARLDAPDGRAELDCDARRVERLDKRKARKGARRISEATLIGWSWATGFVGGWLAMRTFRHKTIKVSFRVKMWLATILNLAWVLVWLGWRGDLD